MRGGGGASSAKGLLHGMCAGGGPAACSSRFTPGGPHLGPVLWRQAGGAQHAVDQRPLVVVLQQAASGVANVSKCTGRFVACWTHCARFPGFTERPLATCPGSHTREQLKDKLEMTGALLTA